jgi:sialic acid synthase SpsE
MSYLAEIKLALEEIYPINKNVVLLQCTANYPIKNSEVNLNVIKTLQNTEFQNILPDLSKLKILADQQIQA